MIKAKSNLKGDQVINSVTGNYGKEITKKELEKNPKKYIEMYSGYYENSEVLAKAIAIDATVIKSYGAQSSIKGKTVKSGPLAGANVKLITGRPKPKKKAKPAPVKVNIEAEKVKAENAALLARIAELEAEKAKAGKVEKHPVKADDKPSRKTKAKGK